MRAAALIVILSLIVASTISGQVVSVCGTSEEDQLVIRERLRADKQALENGGVRERGVLQYIPIHYHIVGDSNGDGKHKEAGILDQLCDLNAAYAPLEMRFYLNPHPTYGLFNRSINNNNVYSNQSNTFLMNTRRHTAAINVFVVETPASNSGNPGVVLAYYNPNTDWIVERKTETKGGNNATLPHEVGHFFSLNHTFYGYESNPFGPGDAGWPTAPVVSPGGQATERVNGTNCQTAADEICDTPPDYNFGLDQGNCLTYTGGAKDPLGTLVDPMEINFMSYFSGCGTNYLFTPNQQSVMLADRNNSSRNYLNNNFTPVATEINTPTDLLISPAQSEVSQYYDEVLLSWQPVTGATHYLLEVDISSAFNTPLSKSYVTTATSQLVLDLTANKTYQWRVRPFNQFVTCATARQRSFKTSTVSAVPQLPGLSGWQIAPNPAHPGTPISAAIQTDRPIDLTLRLIDAAGRPLTTLLPISLGIGEHNIPLPTIPLPTGIYFAQIFSEKGTSTRKVIIR